MRMYRVGIWQDGYGPRNNFGSVPLQNFIYERVTPFPLYNRLTSSLSSAMNLHLNVIQIVRPWDKVDLYHTFNNVILNKTPWIHTFESILPRVWDRKAANRLLNILARKECRRIIAISRNAQHHAFYRNINHPCLDDISNKICIVYPAIMDREPDKLTSKNTALRSSEILRVLFVGGGFYRKGGDILARVFHRIKNRIPIELTMITSFSDLGQYALLPATKIELASEWQERFEVANVRWFPFKPNEVVRQMMAQSDCLVLPSLDESFGFVLVEAMAVSTVPIAINIRAIPEFIQSGHNGYLIDVPTTSEGRLIKEQTKAVDIEDQLENILISLVNDRKQIEKVSQNARETYERLFRPERLRQELEAIYKNALS